MLFKNKLITICVLFTIITLLSSVLGLFQGHETADHIHILSRFVIVVLAIGSLLIFDWLRHFPFALTHLIHYVVTMLIIFLMMFGMGFFVFLHPNAYRDIFLNYTAIYIGVVAVEFAYYAWGKRSK